MEGTRISASEAKFLHEGVDVNVRADGRSRLDYRVMSVESGILPQANGSARVRLETGGTDILAAVKAEVGEPDPGAGSQGRVECSVECWSSASPQFEGRGASEINAELTRMLSRIVNAPGTLDLESLAIIPDKRCWVVYIDLVVFDSGGNILDGLTLATYAALKDAQLPKLVVTPAEGDLEADIDIDEDPAASVSIDTTGVPICVTFFQIGRHFVVDVDLDEEHCTVNRIVVAINRKKNVVSLSSSGKTGIPPEGLSSCVEAARGIAEQLFKRVDSAVGTGPRRSALLAASGVGTDDYLWA